MSFRASGRGAIAPFIVMEMVAAAAARARAGGDVLHLEVGQPSTPAPQGVLAAARRALDTERLGYTEALGLPDLRDAIAGHYERTYGARVPIERIIVTPGASGAFQLAFLAAFDAGDRVALASPGYPAYRNILQALDLEVVEIETGPETRYQPTPAHLDALDRPVSGLIVASPANPTGTMLDAGAMDTLAAYCEGAGIRLISDELYHGITYGEPAVTALDRAPHGFVVNGFSKYFSMTGWRLGWMIVPEDLARPVECLAQNLFISAATLSQHAAIAAFDCHEELQANLARYAANRAHLLSALPKAGFDRLAPADGAFYIYAEIPHLTNDSVAFCKRMLDETGVAATPGLDFDSRRGHATIRFSFAGATEDMEAATERLARWLA
ncbi:MAG: aminotransferase class I/II-fold pyridoxal phosphate-dependent enzyme [Azospirillaceae bacterium]